MEPDKIYKFVTESMSGWIRIALAVLVNPRGLHESIGNQRENDQASIHSRFVAYSILSIIIAVSIQNVLFNSVSRPFYSPKHNLLDTVIFILLWWLLVGSIIHALCYLLKGKGTFFDTLSVHLQVASTIYVVSNFLSLLVIVLLKGLGFEDALGGSIDAVDRPITLILLLGAIMYAIYVPVSLGALHQLNMYKTLGLSVIPFITGWFPLYLYALTGLAIPVGK